MTNFILIGLTLFIFIIFLIFMIFIIFETNEEMREREKSIE